MYINSLVTKPIYPIFICLFMNVCYFLAYFKQSNSWETMITDMDMLIDYQSLKD